MDVPIPFGKYTMQERLAAGELADVYRATTKLADGRELTVVVKRIRDEIARDPEFANRFVDEARVAALLQHPNIARVYEWGRQDESLFIAMEYIQGTNLASVLQARAEQAAPIPPAIGVSIAAEVLAALDYAHTLHDPFGNPMGIVHRNVCPPNIVLGADGRVRLIDFGLARAAVRVQATHPGQFRGRITYNAPETVGDGTQDVRTDLFSVGVVLYELLSGRKLHAAGGSDPLELQVRADPPSRFQVEVPPALDELVARAVTTDPDLRPTSAAEMRESLLELLRQTGPVPGPEALTGFLNETFAVRAPRGSRFAFGEATSHWFSQGEKAENLQRLSPAEEAGFAPLPAEVPVVTAGPEPEAPPPTYEAPRGRFAAGSTVMAVEAGGLGKKRYLKAAGVVLGAVALVVLVTALVLLNLGRDEGEAPKAKTPEPAAEAEGFAGPLEVKSQPDGVLVFVDGESVEPMDSPPRFFNLRAGLRRIKLAYPGYLPWEGDVELVAGQPNVLERVLEERHGALTLRSIPPGVAILLDGKLIGRTPKTLPDVVAARAHKVVLKARGFKPQDFEVRPGDWPEDPAAEYVLEKKMERPARRKKGRGR